MNEILSRWREYFQDVLNPVKALTRDTLEVIQLREEKVVTAAEVATAIKGLTLENLLVKIKSDPRC